jgi:hypothetical protein
MEEGAQAVVSVVRTAEEEASSVVEVKVARAGLERLGGSGRRLVGSACI